MSRAGKHPVKLKDGTSAAIVGDVLVVKGPKGEIKLPVDTKQDGLVHVVVEEGQVVVTPKDAEDKISRAMWGTMTRNVRCAVEGVSDGFSKDMYMKGVGYKASVSGNKLVLVVVWVSFRIIENIAQMVPLYRSVGTARSGSVVPLISV